MEGFIKTESAQPSVPKLSGVQKAAIFLGEIGSSASQQVLSYVKLSDSQLAALNKAFKNLGDFNPHNEFQVRRENAVLEEAAAFGKMHGIYREIPHQMPSQERTDSFKNKNPEDIAKFLSGLLGKE